MEYMPISWGGARGFNGAAYIPVPWVVYGSVCIKRLEALRFHGDPPTGRTSTSSPEGLLAGQIMVVVGATGGRISPNPRIWARRSRRSGG